VKNSPGGHRLGYRDAREYVVGTLNSVTPGYLRISQNPATGNGSTCYGDSGGLNFLGADPSEVNIVASTTITGDTYCKSTNVTYCLDTRSARVPEGLREAAAVVRQATGFRLQDLSDTDEQAVSRLRKARAQARGRLRF
jgi:hypothetical protein